MSRPRLTVRIRRGIQNIRPLVAVNLENGDAGDFQGLTDEELADVRRALDWLDYIAEGAGEPEQIRKARHIKRKSLTSGTSGLQ
jgi:hypothetical protein